ncbi:uncharacterized protein [Henckelia pumila]|uniref:uncharacterized protein isoform X4 n=1 Tax=Henckelia pumila TaxID=405737 RepID=UPI003C6E157C
MQPCGWADTPGVATSLLNFSNVFSGNFRTMEEGAYTIIWLALQPKEKLVSGSKVVKMGVLGIYWLVFAFGLAQTLPHACVILCLMTLPW